MLERLKRYWKENGELICAGLILQMGGDYRPYGF